MNTPAPKPSQTAAPAPEVATPESQIRAWLQLRRELIELHARLEYLKLLVVLGVRQSRR